MIYPLFILRQDMCPCDRLQDACFLQLPDGPAGVMILADGRPTPTVWADWVLQMPEKCYFPTGREVHPVNSPLPDYYHQYEEEL
jgi:hypothetical protein